MECSHRKWYSPIVFHCVFNLVGQHKFCHAYFAAWSSQSDWQSSICKPDFEICSITHVSKRQRTIALTELRPELAEGIPVSVVMPDLSLPVISQLLLCEGCSLGAFPRDSSLQHTSVFRLSQPQCCFLTRAGAAESQLVQPVLLRRFPRSFREGEGDWAPDISPAPPPGEWVSKEVPERLTETVSTLLLWPLTLGISFIIFINIPAIVHSYSRYTVAGGASSRFRGFHSIPRVISI